MTFSLVDFWWGIPCAIHRSRDPAPFAWWKRVSPEEYAELAAEGFRVCRSWVGPVREEED